jgi:V8-like Glu-specific endopeptidase
MVEGMEILGFKYVNPETVITANYCIETIPLFKGDAVSGRRSRQGRGIPYVTFAV